MNTINSLQHHISNIKHQTYIVTGATGFIGSCMVQFLNEQGKFKTKMLLQVHDELVFDVYKPELETVKPIIEKLMREALPLHVPVPQARGVRPWMLGSLQFQPCAKQKAVTLAGWAKPPPTMPASP